MFIVMHYIFNPRHSNHLDLQQNYKISIVNLNLGLKREHIWLQIVLLSDKDKHICHNCSASSLNQHLASLWHIILNAGKPVFTLILIREASYTNYIALAWSRLAFEPTSYRTRRSVCCKFVVITNLGEISLMCC